VATCQQSDAVGSERALLGAILLGIPLLPVTEGLSSNDFALDSHRSIFATMVSMSKNGQIVDLVTLNDVMGDRVEACGGVAYIASLVDGCDEKHAKGYAQNVREAAHWRRVKRQKERIAQTPEDQLAEELRILQDLVNAGTHPDGWKSLFHSYEDIVNAPPATFAIDGFLQEDGITMIGGLAGHGKTWVMLAMVRALLEGSKLFNYFPVPKPAERVIYLIPEAGLGPFAARLKKFRLEQYVRDGRFFCRTLSAQGQLPLTDHRLLAAVKGADVFLDTAIRFMDGDENGSEQRILSETLFNVQRAGARTITGAHHSPKSFEKADDMTLENVLRGHGDIGAMLCCCWGFRQIDAASNQIFVQNVKARDFLPCEPFIIQGRPSIDERGEFDMPNPPRFAGVLSDHKPQAGRSESNDRKENAPEVLRLKDLGVSTRKIAEQLHISHGMVQRILKENAEGG
jgi:hypothetical protein